MSIDGYSPPASSGTAGRLLQAACELAGGDRQLAQRLDTSVALLRRCMAGQTELPQHLMLRLVDLLLEEREARFPFTGEPGGAAGEDRHDGADLSG